MIYILGSSYPWGPIDAWHHPVSICSLTAEVFPVEDAVQT